MPNAFWSCPRGDVRFTPDEEWEHLLSNVAVPVNVDAIWLSYHDLVTDTVCGWTFQAIWPALGEEHVIGCVGGAAGAAETVAAGERGPAPRQI